MEEYLLPGQLPRTATNIQNGGRTPLAGIFHAVTLLLIVEFFGQYASAIPLAILSGILLTVALNMSEYRLFFKMFRAPKSDVVIMLTTFILTILVDLTVAISNRYCSGVSVIYEPYGESLPVV